MAKDSLVDLYFSGIQSEELYLLYELNKTAITKIKTPFRYTDEFQVDMILKQGTVNGPIRILCCCSVGKFSDHCPNNNIIVSKNEIEVPPIAFVDDINGLADNTSRIAVLNPHAEVYQTRKRLNFKVEKYAL